MHDVSHIFPRAFHALVFIYFICKPIIMELLPCDAARVTQLNFLKKATILVLISDELVFL